MINLDFKFGGIVESVDIIKDGKVLEHKVFNKHNSFLKKGQEILRKYFGGLNKSSSTASFYPDYIGDSTGACGVGLFINATFRYGSGNAANTDSTMNLESQVTGIGTIQKANMELGTIGAATDHTIEYCLYPVLFPVVTAETTIQEFGVQFSGYSQFITRTVFPEAVVVPAGGQLLVNYSVRLTLPSIANTVKRYTIETSPFAGINLPCSILMDNPIARKIPETHAKKVVNLSLFSCIGYDLVSSVSELTKYKWSGLFTSVNAYDKLGPTDTTSVFGYNAGYMMHQGRTCLQPTQGTAKTFSSFTRGTPLNSICPIFGLSDLPNGELSRTEGWILKGGEDAEQYPRLCPWTIGGTPSANAKFGYRGTGDELYIYDEDTVSYTNTTTDTSLVSKAIIRPGITADKQVYWMYFNGIMVYFNGESFTLKPNSSLELTLKLSIS